jgi:hypothetical protein
MPEPVDGSPTLDGPAGAGSADDAAADPGHRRHRWWAAGVATALVVVAVVAYAWPAVARPGNRIDVLMAGDAFVQSSRQALERHLRENGHAVTSVVAASSSLCADRDAIEEAVRRDHPAVLVLSYRRDEPACAGIAPGTDPTLAVYDAVMRSAPRARVVLALQPGRPGAPATQEPAVQATYAALLTARRASVADPSNLLGGELAPVAMPCQWWDDCRPDGTVAVRVAPGGALTGAGQQRFARVVVGTIP